MKKVILIVLDSVGIGYQPDAGLFGDVGADTLGHVLGAYPGTSLPVLREMGLFLIEGTAFYDPSASPSRGAFGRLTEVSPGKDTVTGHWEMMGITLPAAFPTYPNGFPEEFIQRFADHTGRGVLGNCVASGTEILDRLGPDQQRTGDWIVYTSADSVFQVAAHEQVIPLEELYEACTWARQMLTPPHNVGRVIARPYIGEPGSYMRTSHRRDFALTPFAPTVLNRLSQQGIPTCGVGKINDIFAGSGIGSAYHTDSNLDGLETTLQLMEQMGEGLLFVNLVDFDMKYGHRNNAAGYACALAETDTYLGRMLSRLGPEDILMVTADHGCDPLFPGTDHTREYVPLLMAGPPVRPGVNLGTRRSFTGVGETIAAFFDLPCDEKASFWDLCKGV